jgi:hypothetical protein
MIWVKVRREREREREKEREREGGRVLSFLCGFLERVR